MKNNIDKPLVTIITVCYNAAEDLKKTINSVMSQTINKKEFIVVDGGSKDSSCEIIKEYESYIDRWISEPDKGVYDAMNKGIAMSSGEWICFMNAGDTFKDNSSLQAIFDSKEFSPQTGVIYCDVNFVFPNFGFVLKKMDRLEGEEQALSINHQASLTRSALLTENLFDLNYKIASDANTFYKLWNKGVKFEYVPVCMANYEVVSGLSSSKFVPSFKERTRILGLRWNNSVKWWVGYLKAYFKMVQRMCLSPLEYEKNYYNRIAKRYQKQT